MAKKVASCSRWWECSLHL